jgi:hypothetical protein
MVIKGASAEFVNYYPFLLEVLLKWTVVGIVAYCEGPISNYCF